MNDWVSALERHAAANTRAVLVSVVAIKGSAPRPAGTRMVVTVENIDGTIGGGHLEFTAIDIARDLLDDGGRMALRRFALGASLGQCCGGMAMLLFEPVTANAPWLAAVHEARAARRDCAMVTAIRVEDASEPEHAARIVVTADAHSGTLGTAKRDRLAIEFARNALVKREAPRLLTITESDGTEEREYFLDVLLQPEFRIVLFGAGHVGSALVRILAGLPCSVTWVDSRDAMFPQDVAANVECVATDAPEAEVAGAAPGSYFLVMTHSHQLDETLTEAILNRDDFAYFGLIGSVSKRRQFERRLEARGVPRTRFDAMTCPIGVAGVTGKEPEVIAVAVAAELLQICGRRIAERDEQLERRA